MGQLVMEVNELEYNTRLEKLKMPEYGRNIQRMVDHALTIEDREERMRCAQAIISIMGNMFPHLRDIPDFKHKLWDHLAIMADFKLDIDYPYEVIQKENLESRPEKIPYSNGKIRVRHYGHFVDELIEQVVSMDDGPERSRLIELIANHMKKCILSWNRESIDDQKIFDDLKWLSDGRIVVEEGSIHLIEIKEVPIKKNPPRPNQSNIRKNQK
jgi:hypothetical protein